MSTKVQYLKWMDQYGRTAATESFNVVEEYLQSKSIEKFSSDELKPIVQIINRVMHVEWELLLPKAFHLLRKIALWQNTDMTSRAQGASTALEEAFNYLAPLRIDERFVSWNYRPQEILLRELERYLSETICDMGELELYIKLLSKLTLHHFNDNSMDYIDPMKYVMSAGSLHTTDMLKGIRTKTFEDLSLLYRNTHQNPRLRLSIMKAYQNPFSPILPFGQSPSEELMAFDAGEIFKHIEKLCQIEHNILLIDKMYSLLHRIEGILKDQRARHLRKEISTDSLALFQKFYGSYWEMKELRTDWELSQKKKRDFAIEYVEKIDESNLDSKLDELSEIQKFASLERENLELIGFTMYELGVNGKLSLPQRAMKVIQAESHPLLPYSRDLLLGIANQNPNEKHRIAKEWIAGKDIGKLRMLASTFAWHSQAKPTPEEIDVIESLFEFHDDNIDGYLVNAMPWIEQFDSDWANTKILELSKTVPEQTYGELLRHLEPHKSISQHHLTTLESHPETFKQIIFNTARLPSMDDASLSHHLSNCLRALLIMDPENLFEYFRVRLNLFNQLSQEDRFSYRVFPYYSIDLKFIRNDPGFDVLLDRILKAALQERQPLHSWLQIIPLLYGTSILGDAEFEGEELDQITFRVFANWINGTIEQRQLIVSLLGSFRYWSSWFNLVRLIVVQNTAEKDRRSLFAAFYTGSHHGSRSIFLSRRIKMIEGQERDNDSPQMKQFLVEAKEMLRQMVQREKEQEELDGYSENECPSVG